MNNIQNTLDFISLVISKNDEGTARHVEWILNVAEEVKKMHDRGKPTYHINLLDLLWADENANSRILLQLLRQYHSGRYEVLESFVRTFMPSFSDRIEHPVFTAEEHRIDLLVREPGRYAIIFENKIHGAVLQKNQIARYINVMKDEGFDEEQIYVVFLPNTDEYRPNICCMVKPAAQCAKCPSSDCEDENCRKLESYREAFEDRFFIVSFRDSIIPWLTDDILSECRVSDRFLHSALIQYIDFLRGLFNQRIYNNKTQMEIQQHVKNALNLTDNARENHKIIKSKIKEVEQVVNALKTLEAEVASFCLDEIYDHLKVKYPSLETFRTPADNKYPSVGARIKVNGIKLRVLLEESVSSKEVYYGIVPHISEEYTTVYDLVKPLLDEIGGFKKTPVWCGWKYTSFENGEMRISYLIDKILEIIDSETAR